MAPKYNILLCDLYHDYRPNHICIPLGVGFIASYLDQELGDKVSTEIFKSPGDLSTRLNDKGTVNLVGFSNYSWNVNLNKHYQNRIKNERPDTVIIEGGPHIRIDSQGIKSYLQKNHQVDFYVMLEGEFATKNLILELLEHKNVDALKTAKADIPGIAYLHNNELVYTPLTSSKTALEKIPSPYLTGKLDKFLSNPNYIPLLETNRGCPFACTFCAWGISVLNKVRKFETKRVLDEIDYVRQRSKSAMWYFTDANYGMFERDIEIAHAIKSAVNNSNYFSTLSVNWAKNSSKFCTQISHILSGISEPLIAVQSTDQQVLKAIKRANIKMNTMTDMVSQSQQDGIPMTTDVLAGLPNETFDSHLNTLRDVFSLGFQSFNVGLIRMLPGSEMETQLSRELYSLETKFRYIAGFMGIYDGVPICEIEESIVKTSSMSFEETLKIRLIHFVSWALWNSGLAQPLLRYLYKNYDINPLDAMMELFESDLAQITSLFNKYTDESKNEWYDTEKDAIEKFMSNCSHGNVNEALKLNLKYLAEIMQNKDVAKALLEKIAEIVDDPVADEMAKFSLDRLIFLDQLTKEKRVQYSDRMTRALKEIYPSLEIETNECMFSIDTKKFTLLKNEICDQEFIVDPSRGLTILLQRYGTKLQYEQSFGGSQINLETEFFDSFDYADQLNMQSKKSSA